MNVFSAANHKSPPAAVDSSRRVGWLIVPSVGRPYRLIEEALFWWGSKHMWREKIKDQCFIFLPYGNLGSTLYMI